MIVWSIGLSYLWRLDYLTMGLFNCLALLVLGRFWKATTVYDYQVAFYWYNVSHLNTYLVKFMQYLRRYRYGYLWLMHFRDIFIFLRVDI